jgi:hypothetical protein
MDFLLRISILDEFFQAFLFTEIVILSRQPLSYRRSLWDIGLAVRILDEFFRLRLSIYSFPRREDHFHQEIEKIIEDGEKDCE